MTHQKIPLQGIDATTHKLYRLIKDVFVLLDFSDRYILQEFDLTPSQYRVLTLLYQENDQRLATLADHMLVARSTITRIVDQMEVANLVKRVIDPGDRRAQHVNLTPTGVDLLHRSTAAHLEALQERFACLDQAEERAFITSLEKLCEIFQSKLDELTAKVN
jgi:MarR family 2-MHQ and catechol resistance regulon transcriptional repressor